MVDVHRFAVANGAEGLAEGVRGVALRSEFAEHLDHTSQAERVRGNRSMKAVQGTQDARLRILPAHERRTVLDLEELGTIPAIARGERGTILVVESDVDGPRQGETHERGEEGEPPIDRLGLKDKVRVIGVVD